MSRYEIKDVVCDYGLYEDGELKLILNSAHNAHLVKRILEIDVSVPNAATPADFVEVVRCKDCEYCNEYRKFNSERYLGCNTNGEIYEVEPNHFCSYGKRKEK